MRSHSTGRLRFLFFVEWLRFFAPPVFLPQTWTATPGAQHYCANALHSADKLLLPYIGPICHHGCRALHHNLAIPSFPGCSGANWSGREPASSIPVLVIRGVIRFHCRAAL